LQHHIYYLVLILEIFQYLLCYNYLYLNLNLPLYISFIFIFTWFNFL